MYTFFEHSSPCNKHSYENQPSGSRQNCHLGKGRMQNHVKSHFHEATAKNRLPGSLQEQDVDVRDVKGQTALHLAAKGGSAGLVTGLVSAGCDVEARDTFGRTPLHHAVAQKHGDATKALLRCRASNSHPLLL